LRTASQHYLRGRPAYSPALIRRVAEHCGPRDDPRLPDLGCGPGQLALAFAFFAGSVVAIDPEPEMLRIAAGVIEGIAPNVELESGSSADLSPRLGRFRMAVMGRSFHWMDRAETLGRLDALIVPAGAVALFEADHQDVPENAWLADYAASLECHAGDDPVQAASRTSNWVRREGMLLESPCSQPERIVVIERRRVPRRSAGRPGAVAVEYLAGPARGLGRSARRGDPRIPGRRRPGWHRDGDRRIHRVNRQSPNACV
jgi:SAM-dependent methyltransferase